MEYKDKSIPLKPSDGKAKNKEHKNVLFGRTEGEKVSKIDEDKLLDIEKRADKLKKIQQKEIEKYYRNEDALARTEILDLSDLSDAAILDVEDTARIPTIDLKDYKKLNDDEVIIKKSLFEKLFARNDANIDENKIDRAQLEKLENRVKNIEKVQIEKLENQVKKIEKVQITKLENQFKKQEKLEKKSNNKNNVEFKENINRPKTEEEIFEEKERNIKAELEKKRQETIEKKEQERIKEQQEKLYEATMLKNDDFSNEKSEEEPKKEKLSKAEKNIKQEEKRKQREIEDQKRKERLKEEYMQKALEKKKQEEKNLIRIKERLERKKKIEKEQEQAREERREKAKLIQKSKEDSRKKLRDENKDIGERLKDWYNNLSLIKDSKNRREMQRQTLLIDYESAEAQRSEDKIMYKYVAKNKETDKIETGSFAAFSKLDVLSFLIAEDYEVYEVSPQKGLGVNALNFLAPKFGSNELDFFLTQLSTFLKSGITLVDSVKILSKQCKNNAQKQIYKAVIYELTMGENFSEALGKQGTIFPKLLVNMVKTSELTGDLPATLDDMANYYKEMEKTRKQMISAITYPSVILVFALTILVFIMVSVIPQFVGIYGDLGTELPAITVAVIKISNFLQSYWMYVILGVIGFVIVFMIVYKTVKVFRAIIQTMLMNMPIFGKIMIYNEVTMFTKTFASLLNHNVYITDSMEVLSKITSNEVYKMLIFDTITNLARGDAISNSFKNHWAFPTIAYEMILTGEKTGQLGTMMDKVAEYYQIQHKNAVNQIKAFIEPVMIVALAAIVGVILLSVVLPMFDMYQNVG